MIWLFIKTNWKIIGISLFVMGLFAAWQIDRNNQFNSGRETEKQLAIVRANALIKKMEQNNDAIDKMGHAAKCAELGFKWLPERGCY